MSPQRAAAVAEALRTRLHWALHSASLRPGERLPSVRELAAEYDVDARTVLRACRMLADEGLIDMRRRSGMYVTLPPVTGGALRADEESIVDILMESLDRGISPAELPGLLDARLFRDRIRVACIDSNADHALAICRMATEMFGVEALPVHLADLERGKDDNPLTSVSAALATSFHAAEVRVVAERFGCPVFVATMDPVMGIELMRQLASRAIYIVGTDRRWAERGATVFERMELGFNMHLLIVGEDDLRTIPDDAEVFVTPAVTPMLPTLPIADRARVLRYTLTTSEARGLLSVILSHSRKARENPI